MGASLSWSDSGPFLLQSPLQRKRENERENWGKEPSLPPSLSLYPPLFLHYPFFLSHWSLVYIFVTSLIWVLSLLPSRILFFLLLYCLALCGLQLLVKMMKRARRVVIDSSPSSSHLLVGEDARARFKHLALLQDYEELLRETEAKRRKLQRTMLKKLKLTAEVKFLRRKLMSFARNPSQETPCRLKKLPCEKPSPSPSATSARPQNSISNANLPPQSKKPRAKEAEIPTTSALFDLNKNAEEMEGIQVEWEPLKVDKLKRCSVDGEVIAHDLNLSIFKDVGNSSSHVGKRKISWQDQVALRV